MKKLAVVAFGGNALLRGNQIGYAKEQEANAYDTTKNLINLLEDGFNLVITHGNGPQVGNILLQHEAGHSVYKIPKFPLDVCVAESQGSIGYMLEKQLRNVLKEHKINRNVVTFITEVVVDKNDPAFQNPTKPVGPFYLKEEADLLAKANNWIFKEDPRKRGWRRVVPSPKPFDVMNKELIKELVEEGNIVIAVGGGGIPVFYNENGTIEGVEAVIDKDLASAVLAREIGANAFFILTDVAKVCINFNKPNQQELDKLHVDEAKKYYSEGQFPDGSMGPKVLAAISFCESSGNIAIITEASQLNNKNAGTIIYK
jgi:carbamate kinase